MNEGLKQRILQHLVHKPGVYQMFTEKDQLIYVGKAKNLAHRVKSYFQRHLSNRKTAAMMAQVADIKITITASDNEALLLESNLIKQYRPRYNVLFRDDKSYPFLFLAIGQTFPRLDFHRGAKKELGRYFGPYPSAGAVRDTLALVQKLFKLRQCADNFFAHRSRPCLQYQIKRCTAPCVAYVSEADYQQQVAHALLFLEGKSSAVIDDLVVKMNQASIALQFEQAAFYRDQVATLRKLQQEQCITTPDGTSNIDIIGVAVGSQGAVVMVLTIRGGRMLGNKAYFPKTPAGAEAEEILTAFISQYYLSPLHEEEKIERIVVSEKLADKAWLQNALQEHVGYRLKLLDASQLNTDANSLKQWVAMAQTNAEHTLLQQAANQQQIGHQLLALQHALQLANPPERIECFDISHTGGELAVASCIVFNETGPNKKDYRRFNIKGITPGDDYAALQQAIKRRYTRLKEQGRALPDLLIIDGGPGQLKQAVMVMEELQISGVSLLAVSKGPTRKPGLEQLWRVGHEAALHLAADSEALHLIQWARDEAHRFAIQGHRQQRARVRAHSQLELIPGIGEKRRRELLLYFGGWQELSRAGVVDIAKVPGISQVLAERIYKGLHE